MFLKFCIFLNRKIRLTSTCLCKFFFFSAQFIDDVRQVMGIPEWFLTVDSRKTRNLHSNACVQLLLHFKGPIANQLEQDFSRLLSLGKLDAPSLFIPGYINTKRKSKISYKQCGMRDPNEKGNVAFLSKSR